MAEDMPDTIMFECPDCGEETEHAILRGKLGKAGVEGTFRCSVCGRVFSGFIRLPRPFSVRVMLSDEDRTETTSTVLYENEILEVGDEFDLDDGRHVKITLIDMPDGKRVKKAAAPEISGLWVKAYGTLHVKVSVNDNRRTIPLYLDAEPGDEFSVGMIMHFDTWDAVIHAIKTRNKLIRRGSAEARDIVRIYGKKLHGDAALDDIEGQPFNEADYDDGAMDLGEE
ncbi:hypothetical protein AUQ37_04765 [Candidatus Methanomethylophilus sp. 1R26]|nr:hypothetical protein AUQ37_04765 [Candidatus Methanomethylophilus sp. 1R26]TQS80791.1 MAG: hypothetical protein A3Q59_06585 [Methanomethylophilus alvi]